MNHKQVLVTGACGEIGEALVKGLADRVGSTSSQPTWHPYLKTSSLMSVNITGGICLTRPSTFMIMILKSFTTWLPSFPPRQKPCLKKLRK